MLLTLWLKGLSATRITAVILTVLLPSAFSLRWMSLTLPQAEQNIIFTFLCDASVDMFCKWVEDGKQIPLERVIEMTSQLLMHGQMGFVKAHGR